MGGLRERLLELLAASQGEYVPQSYIHSALGASKSRVSELLRELEAEGLVERKSLGRAKLVRLLPGAARPAGQRRRSLRLGLVYSSEYAFLGYLAKKLAARGVSLELVVYDNAIRAAEELAEGRVDAGLFPLVTQLYFYAALPTFKVVGGGARGGYGVYAPEAPEPVALSTKLSTMDLVRATAPELRGAEARYYSSAGELSRLLRGGWRGYVVAYHPLSEEAERLGYRAVASWRELEIPHCCTLAASNALGREALDSLSELYRESLEEYEGNRERYAEWYSAKTGIPLELVRRALREYEVAPCVSEGALLEVAERLAPRVPHASAFRGILAPGATC